jgi:hypothetical protein
MCVRDNCISALCHNITQSMLSFLLGTKCGHRSFFVQPEAILCCRSAFSLLIYHRLIVVNQSTPPLCPSIGIEVMSWGWRGWNGLTHRQELQFKSSAVLSFMKPFYYWWIIGKQSTTGLCCVPGEVAVGIFGSIQWRRRWPFCRNTPCWETVGRRKLICNILLPLMRLHIIFKVVEIRCACLQLAVTYRISHRYILYRYLMLVSGNGEWQMATNNKIDREFYKIIVATCGRYDIVQTMTSNNAAPRGWRHCGDCAQHSHGQTA